MLATSSSHLNLEVVKSFLAPIFPGLRKTHFKNLGLSVFGMAASQSGLLSEIVRGFPIEYVTTVSHKHRLKRLSRFLANISFVPEAWLKYWVAWCVKRFAQKGILLIALDWTGLSDGRMCLLAASPFCGRAIPLLWLVAKYPLAQHSQNRIEERFIRRLVGFLPPGTTPIILADRGFGRTSFFEFLLKLKKVKFVIRVRDEVYITHKGKQRKLSEIKTKPGVIRWHENVSYRQDGYVGGVNIAATVALEDKDPWLLVTNLEDKKEVVAYYATRFQIEEFFRDAKHQLGLEQLQTPDAKKVHRLLFVACITYGLLMLAGLEAEKHPELQACLITGGRLAASVIWLAAKTIRYCLTPVNFWPQVLAFAHGP